MGADAMWMPGAAGMREFTKDFVEQLTDGNRLPLDYSVRSLRVVDFIVDGLRRSRPEQERVERTLFGLGAYVGEVLVRRTGAVWVDFDATQREFFEQPVGIRMPDGRVWNPLGRVANRFAVGPDESVQELYLQLHGRRSGNPARPGSSGEGARKPTARRRTGLWPHSGRSPGPESPFG